MEWEKIFANNATNKGLISKIYKQLTQLNNKKQTTQLKNWQKTQIRGFLGGASGKELACQYRRHKRCRFDP